MDNRHVRRALSRRWPHRFSETPKKQGQGARRDSLRPAFFLSLGEPKLDNEQVPFLVSKYLGASPSGWRHADGARRGGTLRRWPPRMYSRSVTPAKCAANSVTAIEN